MNSIESNNGELWAKVFDFALKNNQSVADFDPSLHMIYEGANTDNPILYVLGMFYNEAKSFLAVSFLIDPDVDECSNIQSEVFDSIDDFNIVTFDEKAHIKNATGIL